jgi:transcription elongation factor GreA-like protein
MTAKEKAKELLDKMNNQVVKKDDWDKASEYAKKDLKRKCLIVIDEIENVGCFVGKECATKEGFGVETTEEFWQDVRLEMERL